MVDTASLEMLLRHLIISLPVLVLIVLFFLLALGRHSSRSTERADEQVGQSPSGGLHALDAQQPSQGGTGTAQTLVAEAPTAEEIAAAAAAEVARLEKALADADGANEPVKMAEINLALGRVLVAHDEEAQGLDAFRSAAGLAALHKAHRLHAEARLELAEAAIRHGDPTTACEHWQMARMAFLDAKAKPEGDKIDRRMRANGCPTDWVLTDF